MIKNKTPKSGFTLIELLTVIAIIGILAGILIPAVGKVKEVANKAKSSNNMRQIALGYATYTNSGGKTRIMKTSFLPSQSVAGVAEFLAEKVELTDANLWIIGTDPAVADYSGTIPGVIGYFDANNNFISDSSWTSSIPAGYDVAVGISGNAPSSTTPLLWTRGLNNNGNWPKSSPWGRGGHIAFLDAHIEWFNQISADEGQLIDPNGGQTNSIEVASGNARIIRAPDYSL